MAPLTSFPLPLPADGPPAGFGYDHSEISVLSTTTAFNTGINQRDTFLGRQRCVVCGVGGSALQHCHIVMGSQPQIWSDLKTRNWIPPKANDNHRYEPRNGLSLCANHHLAFNQYQFFIRFVPEAKRFVFVNYGNDPDFAKFHGKAIGLDIKERHAPFPSLFIIHEMRVRGFFPFAPTAPDVNTSNWQDWIPSEGVLDGSSGSFKKVAPPANRANPANNTSISISPESSPGSDPMLEGDAPSGGHKIVLDASTIDDILAATRSSASWRACQMEGTSWTGTAAENTDKYLSSVGVGQLPDSSVS